MPRSSCLPCCNPNELARNIDSYRSGVLQILCEIEANGGGGGGGACCEILCDPGTGDRVWVINNGSGFPATAYYLDGSAYAGTITALVACGQASTPVSAIEYVICDNGTNKIVHLALTGSTVGAVTYLLLSRTASVVPADWSLVTAGGCPVGVFAEDAATASGDKGFGVLLKRTDTAATQTSANGDYTLPVANLNGSILIDINRTFQASDPNGLLKAEDSAHVDGDAGIQILSRRIDAAASSAGTSGDYATLNTDANGKLWAIAELSAGATTIGSIASITTSIVPGTGATNLGKAEDAATASGDTGVAVLLKRSDTAASQTSADADYTLPVANLNGAVIIDNNRTFQASDANGLLKAEDAASANGDALVGIAATRQDAIASSTSTDGDYQPLKSDASGGLYITRGSFAVAHGANPTAVAAGVRGNSFSNRAGIPFVIGGHPNIITLEAAYTAAQTDTAIITVASGLKIIVTEIEALCSNANTVNVGVRIGFGTTNTPTTTGVVLTHPGIAAGSGVIRGSGAGILGIGADGEDLRINSDVPTTGSLRILVSYYTIES